MDRQKLKEQLAGGVNALILLTIALIYAVTGTSLGDDAVSALGSSRTVYAGRANGFAAVSCVVSWDAEALPDILDILSERDARITFFVSGKWAKGHASLLRRMVEEEHEIGTCGFTPELDGGVQMVARDVAAACGAIREITGEPVRYYCSGLRNRDVSARAAERLELIHVSASADLLSARGDAKDLVERACLRGFDGSILMIQPTDTVREALPGLLDALAEKGLGVATVGKLLKGKKDMVTVKTLENGIRVVMEQVPEVRSVALGVWVDTGSVREREKESGASHMIEHMVFKGTEKRTAEEIAVEMDAVGGNLNAFTSKECTCYYAKVLDEHLPIACDILSDIVLHSTFDPKELKKEKGVVIEEILMTEDSPEDLAAETCNMLFFEGERLAPPILGTKETVSSFTQKKLFAYRDKHYVPKNIVVACAGSFSERELLDLIDEKFGMPESDASAEPLTERFPGGRRTKFIHKDIEQVHISMTLPGFARESDGQYPLAVLSNIIGGSMSSRLFQSIREKRGMAYSVYSYPMSYTDTGTFSLYAGTGEKQAAEVTKRMLDELKKIRKKGVTNEELTRCREQLKGSYLLGMESTSAKMNAIGKVLLLQKREYNEAETISRIECVTMDDIQRILPVCLDPANLCTAFVGRNDAQQEALENALKNF